MAERLINIPETKKNYFTVRGKVTGVAKDNFYRENKTRNGNTVKVINFGVTYDTNATIYMELTAFKQDNVYFYKKGETSKAIPWANRNKFHEDGWSLIGTTIGLAQETDENGKTKNVNITLANYDAVDYLRENLKDGMDVLVKGKTEYSSFINKEGNTVRKRTYVPTEIRSTYKPVDFDAEDYQPLHTFTQEIVFQSIDQEKDMDDKPTVRFILEANVVGYNSIENVSYIVENKAMATAFRKLLKPYNSIVVSGDIVEKVSVEHVKSDSPWGEFAKPKINRSATRELIITEVDDESQDNDKYNKNDFEAALKRIQNAKTAESNFGGSTKKAVDVEADEDDAWGDDDLPF